MVIPYNSKVVRIVRKIRKTDYFSAEKMKIGLLLMKNPKFSRVYIWKRINCYRSVRPYWWMISDEETNEERQRRDSLVGRANSLKKALKDILSVAERGIDQHNRDRWVDQ